MEPQTDGVVTIKDVAARAKLSVAAVSYALRNDPKINAATRERVQAVAQRMGYRPNPRVASLMAHIRRSQARTPGERLAFVWVHTTQAQVRREPFLRKVFLGAERRAKQMGFDLEEFWTTAPGMNDRRLQRIIRARGNVGVVLSPVTTDEASLQLDWEWGSVAAAVIGNVTWTPELHHAGHHHYLGMRTALVELARMGCKRPAAILEAGTNERAKRAWESAFLAFHPTPSRARALLLKIATDDHRGIAEWLKAAEPDALIASATSVLDTISAHPLIRKRAIPLVTLHWSEDARGVGGIDQCSDRVAAHAVDLVVTQLNSNETGAPDLPRMMLFPGRWIPSTG
jgi:DNA-binding LacI/PurR family transcriptional regulator